MFINENLLPTLIVDLVTKYNSTQNINEKVQLELRLKDIVNYINSSLRENTREKRR